jgi:single stranded DNA-binding protein
MNGEMNQIIITGVVSKPVEKRQAGNSVVAKIPMLVKKEVKGREIKCFVDVKCWGGLADAMYETLEEGSRILVSGELEQESWQDKATSKWNYRHVINAKHVTSLSPIVVREPEPAGETAVVDAGPDGGCVDPATDVPF